MSPITATSTESTPPTTVDLTNSNSTSSASTSSSTNASGGNSSSKKRKHEEATTSEKQSLFIYASKNPQLKQRELAEWFELTFHKAINQSTVSRNLKKFKSPPVAGSTTHPSPLHHPAPPSLPLNSSDEDEGADGSGDGADVAGSADVDAALHEWYTHNNNASSSPSDEAALAKATELMKGRKKCSASWLRAWKQRHDIPDAGVAPAPQPAPAPAPSPRAKSEEARRRREIKRLRKEVDKRDGEIARATGKRDEALRRIEELETGTGGGPVSVESGNEAADGESPASEK